MAITEDALVGDAPTAVGAFFLVTAVGTLMSWTSYTQRRMSIPSKAGLVVGTVGLSGMVVFGEIHLAKEMSEMIPI